MFYGCFSVTVVICLSVGYLETLSTETNFYESLFLLSGMGLVKLICTSSLGSRKLGKCMCVFLELVALSSNL